jgi:hypothetical protein
MPVTIYNHEIPQLSNRFHLLFVINTSYADKNFGSLKFCDNVPFSSTHFISRLVYT